MNTPAYTCKICVKVFTGPEPYKQHLVSERHKKRLQMGCAGIGSSLTCAPCAMVFSGDAPYRDHMASAGHTKVMEKLANLSLSQTMFQQTSAPPSQQSGAPQGLQCIDCQIPAFLNVSAAFSHYESAEHKRRKLLAQKAREHQQLLQMANRLVSHEKIQPFPVHEQPQVKAVASPSRAFFICRADENFEDFCKKHML